MCRKLSVLAAGPSSGAQEKGRVCLRVYRHHQKPMWISIRFKKLLKVILKKQKDQHVITLFSHNHGSVENGGTFCSI